MSKFALLGAAAVLLTMSISALRLHTVTRELGTCPSPSVASRETLSACAVSRLVAVRVRKIDRAMVGARGSSAATIDRFGTDQVFVRLGGGKREDELSGQEHSPWLLTARCCPILNRASPATAGVRRQRLRRLREGSNLKVLAYLVLTEPLHPQATNSGNNWRRRALGGSNNPVAFRGAD